MRNEMLFRYPLCNSKNNQIESGACSVSLLSAFWVLNPYTYSSLIKFDEIIRI
jgi:hypothetical protein